MTDFEMRDYYTSPLRQDPSVATYKEVATAMRDAGDDIIVGTATSPKEPSATRVTVIARPGSVLEAYERTVREADALANNPDAKRKTPDPEARRRQAVTQAVAQERERRNPGR